MKTAFTLALLFFFITTTAQLVITNDKITIDADSKVTSFETELEYFKGRDNCYEFVIDNPNNLSISVMKNATMQPVLKTSVSDTAIIDKSNFKQDIKCFKRNTEYKITIKNPTESGEKIYIIKTKSDWSWTTTFGANALFFTNSDKFISRKNDTGNSYVEKIKDGKTLDLMPTIMFTFINNHNDFSYGFSGGLGVNFEEIAVFTGLSMGIGQNLILTGGIGVHKQDRPNSNYFAGQQIDSSITNDNLNSSIYRVNSFFGLSFRLDKNPFGKK